MAKQTAIEIEQHQGVEDTFDNSDMLPREEAGSLAEADGLDLVSEDQAVESLEDKETFGGKFRRLGERICKSVGLVGLVEREGTKEGQLETQIGWHFSPANFDWFDKNWMGSGEGHQAFGHGFYFAKERTVADQVYRTTLHEKAKDKKGVLYAAEIPADKYLLEESVSLHEQPEPVIESMRKLLEHLEDKKADFHRIWSRIPEKSDPLFNDWKRQSSENYVRKDIIEKMRAELFEEEKGNRRIFGYPSQSLYKDLARMMKARYTFDDATNREWGIDPHEKKDDKASDLLVKYGVKGILHHGERDGDVVVVFDAADTKVVDKAGWLKSKIVRPIYEAGDVRVLRPRKAS